MPSLITILAPLTLLLPIAALGVSDDAPGSPVARNGPLEVTTAGNSVSGKRNDLSVLSMPIEAQTAQQVRIERRVILRVSPRPSSVRRNLMADLPRAPVRSRLVERPMGKCVGVSGIAGVKAERGNRLVLFMRDRRIVAADLEKACTARDFYSGFYLEPSEDGQLCVDRDRLQSRAGAKCQVSRMRQIVAVAD